MNEILLIVARHNARQKNSSVRFMRQDKSREYTLGTARRAQRLDDVLTDHTTLENFLVKDEQVSIWFEPKE